MPSQTKKPSKKKSIAKKSAQSHVTFVPILVLTFILWVLYRKLFQFPIWFDESIGKALFFGFPVWLYISMSRSKKIIDSLAQYKLQSGLFLGLAFGGVFGFATSILSYASADSIIFQEVLLFSDGNFWKEFFLAILTGFWESLLFYGFVMVVLLEKFPKWSVTKTALWTAGIFLIFHLPNIILRPELGSIAAQSIVLFLFGLGQAYLFYRWRNVYALTLSHAIWGMVLLFLHS